MKYLNTILNACTIIASVMLCRCGLGAGNIGSGIGVPSNISKDVIQRYDSHIKAHEVPDSLDQYVTHYDHLNTYGLYFKKYPDAIYTVTLSSGFRVIHIYSTKTGLRMNGRDDVEDVTKLEVQQRMLSQVVYPIWRQAINDKVPDTTLYIFPNCKSYKVCN